MAAETPADQTTFQTSLRGAVLTPTDTPTRAPPGDARYVRLRVHAQGGMGRVWVARDLNLDRDVALKELHTDLLKHPTARIRFLREAEITGQLEHPGIVPVYELAQRDDDEHPYYTMRFVNGRTVTEAAAEYHQKLQAGDDATLDLATLLHAFVMVCNTIGFAHSRGVIHRDLKGQNVILGDFGEVVVLDWGLAKQVDVPEDQPDARPAPDVTRVNDWSLTVHGSAMGTPASMSPEQAAGQIDRIDHRTDIYGLGAILYEILTGLGPFTGSSSGEVLRKVIEEEPKPPREVRLDVPHGLEAICLRALAKKPEDRYGSAKELADAVQQWQEAERRRAEEALRESEAKYRSLADLIPGIVWTSRPDGWIDFANQFWFNFTGLTMEQTTGSGWAAAVHPDDLPRVSELWMDALRSGEAIEVDYRVRRAADGAYRWFLAQARPVHDDDGRIVKWFGMLTEIEDQKKGEQALARQNAFAQLLHSVTVAAYEANTIAEALQAAVDEVCAITHWPVGHVYLLGPRELVPSAIWHLERPAEFESFVRVTMATRLAPGEGLPGRVLAEKRPAWIMDVTRDDNFPRAKAAANLGVKGAFAFPVATSNEVVAVLEFFTSEPQEPDDLLLRAMAQIGEQLGRAFERRPGEVGSSEITATGG
jgi:PAS domain S-box-containing protein